jgi:hypothetical protein
MWTDASAVIVETVSLPVTADIDELVLSLDEDSIACVIAKQVAHECDKLSLLDHTGYKRAQRLVDKCCRAIIAVSCGCSCFEDACVRLMSLCDCGFMLDSEYCL